MHLYVALGNSAAPPSGRARSRALRREKQQGEPLHLSRRNPERRTYRIRLRPIPVRQFSGFGGVLRRAASRAWYYHADRLPAPKWDWTSAGPRLGNASQPRQDGRRARSRIFSGKPHPAGSRRPSAARGAHQKANLRGVVLAEILSPRRQVRLHARQCWLRRRRQTGPSG